MSVLNVERMPAVTIRARTARPYVSAWLRNPWLWIALVISALSIWWVDLPFLRQIMNRDEGAFFVIAQQILHGHLPYRDAFDHKPPGTYYLLALVLAVTSPFSVSTQVLAMRLLALLANFAVAAGLIILGKRWKSIQVGVLAAGLWLFAFPLFQGDLVLTEPFASAAIVWTFVVATGKPGFRTALLAGLLTAVSSFFKQTSVLALPAVVLILLAGVTPSPRWLPTWLPFLTVLAGYTLGCVLPWLFTAGFFALAGGFDPFIQQVVFANLRYPPDTPHAIISGMRSAFYSMPLVVLLPIAYALVSIAFWLRQPSRLRERMNVGLVAAALAAILNLTVFISHSYYHYCLQIVPRTALLCAAAIMSLLEAARPSAAAQPDSPTADTALRSVLLPIVICAVLAFGTPTRLGPDAAKLTLDKQIAGGEWIRRTVPANAHLLILAAEPEYYFLSGYAPSTSYIYILPVNATPALIAQVNNQLAREDFDYVIWFNPPRGDPDYQASLTDTHTILTTHYHITATNHDVALTLFAANR